MGSPVSSLSSQSTSSTTVVPQTEAVGQVKIMAADAAEPKPKKKICCACPETKKLRDECIVEHGEAACTKWIEAHRVCLRAEGFKV